MGYVSSFFHEGQLDETRVEPVNRHDRRDFEIHLFSDAPASAIEHGYAAHPDDRFHDISALSNDAGGRGDGARRAGSAGRSQRLQRGRAAAVFMQRPAPVIAGWFNMYATTGMPCFDYLIGDEVVIPPEEERFTRKRILRVPGSYLSFEVNYPVPEVEPRAGREGGAVRFGCLAPLYKITPQAVAAWSEILRRAPGATLLLKNTALGTADNRDFVARLFAEHGVGADRLRLEGPAEHFQFLEAYGRIDVALDTFPYNGGTDHDGSHLAGRAGGDVLGDRWVSRTSASILRAGGLGAVRGGQTWRGTSGWRWSWERGRKRGANLRELAGDAGAAAGVGGLRRGGVRARNGTHLRADLRTRDGWPPRPSVKAATFSEGGTNYCTVHFRIYLGKRSHRLERFLIGQASPVAVVGEAAGGVGGADGAQALADGTVEGIRMEHVVAPVARRRAKGGQSARRNSWNRKQTPTFTPRLCDSVARVAGSPLRRIAPHEEAQGSSFEWARRKRNSFRREVMT